MDITISSDCVVRRAPEGVTGERFELRVGVEGWHREAALLTVAQAEHLKHELTRWLRQKEG